MKRVWLVLAALLLLGLAAHGEQFRLVDGETRQLSGNGTLKAVNVSVAGQSAGFEATKDGESLGSVTVPKGGKGDLAGRCITVIDIYVDSLGRNYAWLDLIDQACNPEQTQAKDCRYQETHLPDSPRIPDP